MKQRTYIAIGLKSFYATVECRERGLDPMDTNLVVADESRTDKTICLAVTPSLKSYGISGRGRLFEVKQRVKEANAGTRKLPITEDVAQMFQAIIEDRVPPKVEKVIDGYSGFLFYDENDMPLVAMHWQHRFNHMVGRYNDIYRVQMPNITPHVCRHTYCSNMAKSGMNPKTLQYLMGHSDISVTMNVYTHIGFDDAEEELKRMEEFQKAQVEMEKKNDAKSISQKMFKAI